MTKELVTEERSIPEMRTKDAGLVPREGGQRGVPPALGGHLGKEMSRLSYL